MPGRDAAHPATPGVGFRNVNEALRELANLHDTQTARIVHIHQAPDQMDIMVFTGPTGDQAIRIFHERLKNLNTTAAWTGDRPISPKDWINVTRLADYFQHQVGPTGATASDAIRDLGPWKPEEFKRDMPGFKKWQEAFHDCRRGGLLKNELERRGLRFHSVTQPGRDGKPVTVRNDFGEDYWRIEAMT